MHDKIGLKDEGERFEQYVDGDTTFVFPQVMTEHSILGKHLIIAPEQANWLVCDDEEYVIFCLLREGKSIQEVEKIVVNRRLMSADKAEEIVARLVAQILGKEFKQKTGLVERDKLKVVSISLTAGCNLCCSTCLLSATVAGSNECLLEDWKRFLKAFAGMGGETVTLTGGEPMTSPIFADVITFAKSLGLKVVVLTNGTLVNRENAKFLGENCKEIQLSIDGPDAKTHDSVRGKGTFEKVIYALEALSSYPQCHISIAMTPTPDTMFAFQTRLIHFAERVWSNIGQDISIRVTQKLEPGRRIPTLSDEEQAAFKRKVVALCDDQLEIGLVDKLDANTIIPNRLATGCGLAEFFSVKANGDIRLCEFFSGSLGNIKDIGEDGAALRRIADRVKRVAHSLKVENLSSCRECDLRYLCGGKCRSDNRVASGNPKICDCDKKYKNVWYERLVRISPYIVQPVPA